MNRVIGVPSVTNADCCAPKNPCVTTMPHKALPRDWEERAMTGKPEASTSTIGDARRLQIVQAAREICLEKGFSKITISDIAERVGMTRSLFYHYFQDKDQVADAMLDDVISEVIARLKEWNEHREAGNISKALDDVVRLTRSLIADEGPFSQRLIEDGNAALYLRFIDRAADRISEYLCGSTVREFEEKHGMPIRNEHETFYTLIVGLISLIRLHPDIDDDIVRQVAAQTLHLDEYL